MIHREDIKATLRKKYGSLLAFEEALGLPANSVSDVLRGRAVAKTRLAIANAMGVPVEELFAVRRGPVSSIKTDDTAVGNPTHRLNQEAA